MDLKKIDERLSVNGQITPQDIVQAAAQGFRTIINNRPDGEEPGQPTSAELAATANAYGLAYRHIPITPGQFDDGAIAEFKAALEESPGPVLGFCRTGTRCATLWGLVTAPDKGVDETIDAAAQAGCDISGARPRLEECASC